MKKKEIYANKITKIIDNNQRICEVENDNNYPSKIDTISPNVEEKLNKLFNTNGYIFNINVKIITNDKTYNTKIASRIGNNLITLDNDVIIIDDIKDIIF